ncbi:GNAT family N-acetyltransferase [Allostreptomyces psammosilenae]|uniref:RimJ/RimL family protein N-acetyltransferase n=1 Tax=Allostreptomyces psammosilenae TaxID=1892865 RepID=A0A853A0X0_9ACTN|nr:GNAT family N-acetyltransferase [Allostreptomyces psammosilenae]NYI07787.1 RimJ/RimL family protein N-acetyltransferase [Allostreptomyces psammosilenae]
MTAKQQHPELTIRPITGPAELDLFNRFRYELNDELADDLDTGRRRPEWLWVALRGDRLVARAAWWGRREDAAPLLMDVFDLDDTAGDGTAAGDDATAATALLRTALAAVVPPGGETPEYTRFVPPDWRERPAARRIVERRTAVLESLGARLFVERLRLEWRPGTALPPPSDRLTFRPVRDRDELVALMTLVLDGTLDAHSRADLARMPPAEVAARGHDNELTRYAQPTDWWRIATLPTGDPVGFVIPGHNGYNHIIGYIGVLPAHRGHGYVDDILAEGTRLLAARNAPRVRAATDLANTPMAAAFRRAGYVDFQRELNMTWPDGH